MAEQHDTDKLLSLARECGATVREAGKRANGSEFYPAMLEMSDAVFRSIAERLRQDERERCAVICDELHDRQINSMCSHNYHRFAAAAIRSGASHG